MQPLRGRACGGNRPSPAQNIMDRDNYRSDVCETRLHRLKTNKFSCLDPSIGVSMATAPQNHKASPTGISHGLLPIRATRAPRQQTPSAHCPEGGGHHTLTGSPAHAQRWSRHGHNKEAPFLWCRPLKRGPSGAAPSVVLTFMSCSSSCLLRRMLSSSCLSSGLRSSGTEEVNVQSHTRTEKEAAPVTTATPPQHPNRHIP